MPICRTCLSSCLYPNLSSPNACKHFISTVLPSLTLDGASDKIPKLPVWIVSPCVRVLILDVCVTDLAPFRLCCTNMERIWRNSRYVKPDTWTPKPPSNPYSLTRSSLLPLPRRQLWNEQDRENVSELDKKKAPCQMSQIQFFFWSTVNLACPFWIDIPDPHLVVFHKVVR